MNDKYEKIPFSSDEGKNCIFVSYAHKDRAIIYPIITDLYEKGWPIWYDEGIEPGENWKAALSCRIGECGLYLLFISANSLKSIETIDHEFVVAHNYGKEMVICVIDDSIDLKKDFAQINYATASFIDIPCIHANELETFIADSKLVVKGPERTAQGISIDIFDDMQTSPYNSIYEYEICHDGVALTKYLEKDHPGIIRIPREYPLGSGNPVVELRGTFCDANVKGTVIIPDTVQRIKSKTFYGTCLPCEISIPPSIEEIEPYAISYNDYAKQTIHFAERKIRIKYAGWSDIKELTKKNCPGIMKDFINDVETWGVCSMEKNTYSGQSFVYFSYASDSSNEVQKIISTLKEKDCMVLDCADFDDAQSIRNIRESKCMVVYISDNYYGSSRCEDLYAAISFEKNTVLLEPSFGQISHPDNLIPYLAIKQSIFIDDPDYIAKLVRYISRNGCRNYTSVMQKKNVANKSKGE